MKNNKQNIILDSITEGVFTVDLDWQITSFNKAAEEITGIQREKAIGQHCSDILRADVCESGCALRRTIETGKSIINKPVHIINVAGKRKTISISTALFKDKNGNILSA